MSGHLLSSVNRDAAEAIGRGGNESALPGVGELVIFYPRPGELRAGVGRHTALVTRSNEDDNSLDLVVVYDSDDLVGQRRVPKRSLDGGMGWETPRRRSSVLQVEHEVPGPATAPEVVAALMRQVEALEKTVAGLQKTIFGEFEAPPEAFVEILSDHEDRLIKLEPVATKKPATKKAAAKKGK
jgi:hypothetical protein